MSAKSAPQSAEKDVLDAIDSYMAQTENAISIPYSALNQAVSDYINENGKAIKRVTERILREADKHYVATDNAIDAVTTGLLGGIDSYLGETEFMLRDLASRAGMIQPGDPLEAALLSEQAKTPQIEYGATLVLAVKEAIPFFEQLIGVLREIRDRMPPVVVQVKGESGVGKDDVVSALDVSDDAGEDVPWFEGS